MANAWRAQLTERFPFVPCQIIAQFLHSHWAKIRHLKEQFTKNIWDEDSRFRPFSCHPDSKDVTGNFVADAQRVRKKNDIWKNSKAAGFPLENWQMPLSTATERRLLPTAEFWQKLSTLMLIDYAE